MIVYKDNPKFPTMTVESLKKRGHCCRSACLHCPYGFTIKRFGIKFLDLSCQTLGFYNELSKQISLKVDFEKYLQEDYKFIVLKDFIIGIIRVDKILVREMELLPSFTNQGISKELVESYYFY